MIRLHVLDDLAAGAEIRLDRDRSHYLLHVMRQGEGAEIQVFNGRQGEWLARLTLASKRQAAVIVESSTRGQAGGADLDLVAALVKRDRLETIVEKAAELGVRRVRLAMSERTNVARVNPARLAAIAVEASEQTGRLDVPQVIAPQPLTAILAGWEAGRRLMFCDESGAAPPTLAALGSARGGAWAVLIGPEGGFSTAEREAVRALPACVPVGLGPRILRADTAAIAALTLWQAALGDWRGA